MRRIPLHPLLAAVFPVLFLFHENIHLVKTDKLWTPLLLVLGCAAVVTAVASLVFRNIRRGAIAATGLLLLALSYGHVWNAAQGKAVFGLVVGRDMFLLPLFALAAALVVWFAWRVKSLDEVTMIVNGVALVMVALMAFNTNSALAKQRSASPTSGRVGEKSLPVAKGDPDARDIYYIMPEDMGDPGVLQKYYGVDQKPFYDGLRKRGFFIPEPAYANYPHTSYSVASSFNFSYLGDLQKKYPHSNDFGPMYEKLVGPKASRFLQQHGYRYMHIGSWWDPTANDPTAQVNFHYDKRSEFASVLLKTTILQPLSKRLGLLKALDGRRVAHNQVLFEFDSIRDVSKLKGPTFTFAHILIPHEPLTFDRNGNYVDEDAERKAGFEKGYAEQVRYADTLLLKTIDKLLDVPDARKPIILLQSDEGPKRLEWRWGETKHWSTAPDEILQRKYPILNAYYFPGVDKTGLYDTITPVNSFRVLFNTYFGQHLAVLPDREIAYGAGKQHELYKFVDVTDRVHGGAGASAAGH